MVKVFEPILVKFVLMVPFNTSITVIMAINAVMPMAMMAMVRFERSLLWLMALRAKDMMSLIFKLTCLIGR